jgi:hypothetical protein
VEEARQHSAVRKLARTRVCLLAVLLLAIACERKDNEGSRTFDIYGLNKSKMTDAKRTTIAEMRTAFDTNPAIFAQRFKGKPVEFSGRIKYILDADELSIGLALDAPQDVFLTSLHNGALDVARFRKGQAVSVRCEAFDADPLRMHFTNCIFLEPNYEKAHDSATAVPVGPAPEKAGNKARTATSSTAAIHPTADWLVGTWAGSEHNPTNNPNAACDTDVTLVFKPGGRFEDGGASGRFKTDGKLITYFDRQSVPDPADEPAKFTPEKLPTMIANIRKLDQNTFSEDGEKWRRCRSS